MSTNLLSASTSHQPFSSSAGPSSSSSSSAPSNAQPGFASIAHSQKPELSFAPFQDLCQDFLAKLDAFVLRGKGEILERKERREQEREKEAKEKRRLEEEIVGAGSKESRLLQVLEKEKQDLTELQQAITELKTNLSSLESQEKVLGGDLAEWNAKVGKLRTEKSIRDATLAEHRTSITRDLSLLEKKLCWNVDGVGSETLLIRFSHLNPSNPAKEYSFIVDISAKNYAIPTISTPLAQLPTLLADLNADRDFYGFLKKVRKAFKEVALAE
ncbi:chromosome segregation protein Spc25-domain-containing protein [Mrakia frigida]|uniref:chromosome segregation protein Spc25-domain-containing protein n=1 Tax=Mrakia frigida TaxID=29902 RepID=UPI003FCC1379